MSGVNGLGHQQIQDQQIHLARLESLQVAKQERVGGDAKSENEKLLVPPEYAPVDGTLELLKMMLDSAHADRTTKKKMEATVDQAAEAAGKSQVANLRAKAKDELDGAWVIAGLQLGTAAASGAAAGYGAAAIGAEAGSPAATTAAQMDRWSGVSAKVNEGAVTVSGGLFKNAVAQDEIAAKQDETRAASLRRSADSLHSDLGDLKQHAGKIFDLVRDIEAAKERCVSIALQAR